MWLAVAGRRVRTDSRLTSSSKDKLSTAIFKLSPSMSDSDIDGDSGVHAVDALPRPKRPRMERPLVRIGAVTAFVFYVSLQAAALNRKLYRASHPDARLFESEP